MYAVYCDTSAGPPRESSRLLQRGARIKYSGILKVMPRTGRCQSDFSSLEPVAPPLKKAKRCDEMFIGRIAGVVSLICDRVVPDVVLLTSVTSSYKLIRFSMISPLFFGKKRPRLLFFYCQTKWECMQIMVDSSCSLKWSVYITLIQFL